MKCLGYLNSVEMLWFEMQTAYVRFEKGFILGLEDGEMVGGP